MRTKFFLSLLFIVALAISCSSSTEEDKDKQSDKNSSKNQASDTKKSGYKLPKDRRYNDMALFLAGIKGDENSTLKKHESSAEWKSYAASLDAIWKKTNAKKPVMTDWAKPQLKACNDEGGLLFYPFSGPDFLHAHVFFPKADSILMIGLEPIGSYPDMDKIAKKSMGNYLNGVRKSLYAILNLSFFMTKSMAVDFKAQVDGTLPVLLQFLARTNHEVLYYEKVMVTKDGKLVTAQENMPDSTYFANKFYYKKQGDSDENIKTLVYFAANLQNTPYTSRGGFTSNGLVQRLDFVKYLKSLPIKTTYLKSASYLMHRETFSIIRDEVILDKSKFILEDDSGIPLKYFDKSKWDLTFYGAYTGTIPLFASRFQNDLKKAYNDKNNTIKPLPFGIGYKYKKGTSNLLLSVKK